MKHHLVQILCIFTLLGGCSSGEKDSAETVAVGGSNDAANADTGHNSETSGGETASDDTDSGDVASCAPAPIGSTIITPRASSLANGCIDDKEVISMYPVNRDAFNFQLDNSGFSAGDGITAKGIHNFSGGFALANLYELNLDIIGTVGDPQISAIRAVEINWAMATTINLSNNNATMV